MLWGPLNPEQLRLWEVSAEGKACSDFHSEEFPGVWGWGVWHGDVQEPEG